MNPNTSPSGHSNQELSEGFPPSDTPQGSLIGRSANDISLFDLLEHVRGCSGYKRAMVDSLSSLIVYWRKADGDWIEAKGFSGRGTQPAFSGMFATLEQAADFWQAWYDKEKLQKLDDYQNMFLNLGT